MSNNQRFLKYATPLFILSVLFAVFGIIAIIFERFEFISIKFPFLETGIVLLMILISLIILKKWIKAVVLLVLLIGFLLSVGFTFLNTPLSQIKSIKNTNYLLDAEMRQYKIWEQHSFYDKIVVKKKSDLFFTPTMKTGIIPFFEVELLSETSDAFVLRIHAAKNMVIDTIFKNEKNQIIKSIK